MEEVIQPDISFNQSSFRSWENLSEYILISVYKSNPQIWPKPFEKFEKFFSREKKDTRERKRQRQKILLYQDA